MLVVDASVIAPFVADGGPDGNLVRSRLRREMIAAPDLLRIEVVSAIRRQTAAGLLTPTQASQAIDDLLDLPVVVHPTASLLRRTWMLRDNLTPYDACYVALAEALDCSLLTSDRRLAGASGTRCEVETI